jgi:hypothetical protein
LGVVELGPGRLLRIGMGLLAEIQVRTHLESQRKAPTLVAEEVNAPCVESPASSPLMTLQSMNVRAVQ